MADAPETRWVLIVGFLVSFATAITVVAGAFYVEVGNRREETIRREYAFERLRDALEKADAAIASIAGDFDRITRRDAGGLADPDLGAAVTRHIERVGGEKFEKLGAARERWERFRRANPQLAVPDF